MGRTLGYFHFVPICCEVSGGSWDPEARKVWSALSSASAKLTGEPKSQKAEASIQTLSVIVHRANARAILRRAPEGAADHRSSVASARELLMCAEIRRQAVAA